MNCSSRKARLVACAFCREHPQLAIGASGQSIALAERFADGLATSHELASARFGGRFQPHHAAWAVCWPPGQDDQQMLERAISWVVGLLQSEAPDYLHLQALQAIRRESLEDKILPEIQGPSPLPSLDPGILSLADQSVRLLARSIYDQSEFEQMPILADALEEAGCLDPRVLHHCRSEKYHVRGCWLLDAILGQD